MSEEQLKQLIKEAVDFIDKELSVGNLGKSEPMFDIKEGKLVVNPIMYEYLSGWFKEE